MFPKKINIIAGIALVVSFFIMGCTTVHEINRDLSGSDSILKKKIAVLPFKDLTGYKDNMFGTMAQSIFKTSLSEHCKPIIVEDDKRDRYLEEMARLDSGNVDPVQQNRVARALGLNAILTGTLLDITITEERKGLWLFKDTFPVAFLELEVHLYDIETNAILLSKPVKAKVTISDQYRTNLKDNQQCDPRLVEELLQRTARQLSEKICTVMAKEPWKGYVISFENNEVEISAGTDVGLRKGNVLEVFRREQPIKGTDGKIYLISGPTIGNIKIKKVSRHTAIAEIVSGADFDKSNCVKLNQNFRKK